MSHKATYWLATIGPKRITAGAFRVLFHLCDYHNDERDPEMACFPSQDTLRLKTGMSNGGLNKCIDALENEGLLMRRRSTMPNSSHRRTYYILGCDDDLTTMQTPQSGGSANSTGVEAGREQTPLLSIANSTFGHSKLHPSGEYPVKEPVKKECVAKNASHTDCFTEFWEAHPRPNDEARSKQLFDEAVDAGADPAHIVAAAKSYESDNKGNSRQYLKYSDNWLAEGKWKNHRVPKSKESADPKSLMRFWSAKINGDGYVAPNAINVTTARALIDAGLVTPQQLKARGIAA